MDKVKPNHLVSILYAVTDKDSGEVIDSHGDKDKPFSFLLGASQVIPGLENALMEREIGSKFNVEIAPEDAYGVRNPNFLQEVPKEQFAGITLSRGMTLFGQSDDGQSVQVIVSDIGEDSIIIDYNHPLAGKTLLFEVEILDSREPSDDEILEMSHSCSCGSGGGCCGGGHHHGDGGCGCGH